MFSRFRNVNFRRLKEKFDNELRDLEKSEQEAKNKYLEVKNKLLESEDEVVTLKAAIKHLQQQLDDSKDISEKLLREKDKMKEVVRAELRNEVELLKKELILVKSERDKELQQIHTR